MLMIFGGVFGIGAVATVLRVYMFRSAGEQIVRDLRRKVYDSLLRRKDISYYDGQVTGDLASRLSSDALLVGNTLTRQLSDGVRSVSLIGLSAAMVTLKSSIT